MESQNADDRERELVRLIKQFQAEPDSDKAQRLWKQIEKVVFGVEYPD